MNRCSAIIQRVAPTRSAVWQCTLPIHHEKQEHVVDISDARLHWTDEHLTIHHVSAMWPGDTIQAEVHLPHSDWRTGHSYGPLGEDQDQPDKSPATPPHAPPHDLGDYPHLQQISRASRADQIIRLAERISRLEERLDQPGSDEIYEPVHPCFPPPADDCPTLYLEGRTIQLWIGDRWVNIHPGHPPTGPTTTTAR